MSYPLLKTSHASYSSFVALVLRLAQSMNETIVRVCAACQSETMTVLPAVSNVAYSHGACRRHALKSFAEIVGIEAAEKLVAAKPESYFCPELLSNSDFPFGVNHPVRSDTP